jgi:hypothetical protein
VSKDPKVSIVRKGFTLIPDYASTAFMMQGCSLEAAIAECGDEFQVGGLSEMMTTYVILSRVKKADGLLLLRAFSRELFRMGMAPGPYCLLKLLRHRFGLASDAGATQEEEYGLEEGIVEYHQRQAEQKRYLALRKLRGSLYKCYDCEKELPPESFGADPKSEDSIREICISTGALTHCKSCRHDCDIAIAEGYQGKNGNGWRGSMVLQPKKECRICHKHRGERYFQGVPDDACSSCLNCPEMPEHFCGNCEKYRTGKEIYFTGEHGDELVCKVCHPEMLLLTCDVCNTDSKPRDRFPRTSTFRSISIGRS